MKRAALNQATRAQTPVGALGKRIGKNRSVQERLDMKIVAELGKIGLFRKGWISKSVAGMVKIGLFRKLWTSKA